MCSKAGVEMWCWQCAVDDVQFCTDTHLHTNTHKHKLTDAYILFCRGAGARGAVDDVLEDLADLVEGSDALLRSGVDGCVALRCG
jgi:hypothetical protein